MLAVAVATAGAAGEPASDATVLVEATAVVAGLQLDLRYATNHNLTGTALYHSVRCLLLPQTAAALAKAQALLIAKGLRLVAWDCYRPQRVQWLLWKRAPTPGLVANPKRGSNHSRGAAVDVTLSRADGTAVEMPTDFDDFSPAAARAATDGLSAQALENRGILRQAMREAGFTTISKEWWHFDLAGALRLPVLTEEL